MTVFFFSKDISDASKYGYDLSRDRQMRQMLKLYRHDDISCNKQSKSGVIGSYRNIRLDKINQSNYQEYSEDILYQDDFIFFEIDDATIYFLLLLDFHVDRYMRCRFEYASE